MNSRLDMLISNPISVRDISVLKSFIFVLLMFMDYICNEVKTNASQIIQV